MPEKSQEVNPPCSREVRAEALSPCITLVPGQLWKLRGGYIEIAALGEKLAHYRILWQPEQRATMTRMMKIGTLQTYLLDNQATLVR